MRVPERAVVMNARSGSPVDDGNIRVIQEADTAMYRAKSPGRIETIRRQALRASPVLSPEVVVPESWLGSTLLAADKTSFEIVGAVAGLAGADTMREPAAVQGVDSAG